MQSTKEGIDSRRLVSIEKANPKSEGLRPAII